MLSKLEDGSESADGGGKLALPPQESNGCFPTETALLDVRFDADPARLEEV